MLQQLEAAANTTANLGEPSLEYFKDTSTPQIIDDFLGFVTHPASSVSITGPDGIVSIPPADCPASLFYQQSSLCIPPVSASSVVRKLLSTQYQLVHVQNFAPCLVSTQPSGVNIYAAAINVVPRLVEIITDGTCTYNFGAMLYMLVALLTTSLETLGGTTALPPGQLLQHA